MLFKMGVPKCVLKKVFIKMYSSKCVGQNGFFQNVFQNLHFTIYAFKMCQNERFWKMCLKMCVEKFASKCVILKCVLQNIFSQCVLSKPLF